MIDESGKTIEDLVKSARRYPEESFLFIRDGLNHAVEGIHGPDTDAHRDLARYIVAEKLDWSDLIAQYHAGTLSDAVVDSIESAGGVEKLNRHVGGRELCWGLRDFALERWGMLARIVLDDWNITSTADFGRIVFTFIEHDLMQQQEGDSIRDFEDVYNFAEAFDKAYVPGSGLVGPRSDPDTERE